MAEDREMALGAPTVRAIRAISPALPGPVSNMLARPPPPRDSMLSTTPTRRARGSVLKKASAPRRPASSPSVNRKITSRSGTGPVFIRRAISSADATPAVSSAAPGLLGTVS